MEPLAKASKSALQSEIDLSGSRHSAAVRDMSQLVFVARPSLEYQWNQLKTMVEIDVVCSVLALAREADKMMRAGRKMGRARK